MFKAEADAKAVIPERKSWRIEQKKEEKEQKEQQQQATAAATTVTTATRAAAAAANAQSANAAKPMEEKTAKMAENKSKMAENEKKKMIPASLLTPKVIFFLQEQILYITEKQGQSNT